MIAYEYETEGFTTIHGKSLTERLNEMGAQGWQLANMQREAPRSGFDSWVYYLTWMRPVDRTEAK
jgi:hypothetical protein